MQKNKNRGIRGERETEKQEAALKYNIFFLSCQKSPEGGFGECEWGLLLCTKQLILSPAGVTREGLFCSYYYF